MPGLSLNFVSISSASFFNESDGTLKINHLFKYQIISYYKLQIYTLIKNLTQVKCKNFEPKTSFLKKMKFLSPEEKFLNQKNVLKPKIIYINSRIFPLDLRNSFSSKWYSCSSAKFTFLSVYHKTLNWTNNIEKKKKKLFNNNNMQ